MDEGDIILLEYEGWTGDPPELFDTTKEELAKEHDLYEENQSYAPMVTIIGGGRLVAGLDEHLKTAEVGKEAEVTIDADKAYGPKDPKLIKLHRRTEIERLLEDKAERSRQPAMPLMVGAEVDIEGQHGHIVMVSGSRVRVDFNHHLAGKELTFKYQITELISDPADRVAKLIRLEYPVEADFDIDVDDNNVARIGLPDICKYDSNWFGAKMRVVASLRKWADITDVHFIESYVAPPPPTPEPEPEPGEDTEGEAKEADGEGEAAEGETVEGEDGEAGEAEGEGEAAQGEQQVEGAAEAEAEVEAGETESEAEGEEEAGQEAGAVAPAEGEGEGNVTPEAPA